MGAYSGFEFTQGLDLPRWLRDDQGLAFEASFGRTKDDALGLYKQATKARYPTATRPDALGYQGHDRRLRRAPPETDAQYTARLLTAHDLWRWGGTPTGIVDIFAPYNYTVTGAFETTPSWGPAAIYSNGDLALASGNVYEMAAVDGQSGTVPPSGYGGAGGGATPQADSFVDNTCLWNFVRAGTGIVQVVPNYAVILEGSPAWFSRFLILCGPLYWESDGVWDPPGIFVGDTFLNFAIPAVGATATVTFSFPVTWPVGLDPLVVNITTAGDFEVTAHTSNSFTLLNTGLPGSAAPGTVISAPQSVTIEGYFWDNDSGVWDSSASIADLDYLRASIRDKKSDESYPVLIGVMLADLVHDGFWDLPADVYDAVNTFWDDDTSGVTYWLLGHFWGEEAYFGGTETWGESPTTDIWDDAFVPPSTGWDQS